MQELQTQHDTRRVEPENTRPKNHPHDQIHLEFWNFEPRSHILSQQCEPASPGLGLGEHVVVDVDHEVAAGKVLHDEADVVAGLEAAVQVDQERVSGGVDHLEDPLLTHEAAEGTRQVFRSSGTQTSGEMCSSVCTNHFKRLKEHLELHSQYIVFQNLVSCFDEMKGSTGLLTQESMRINEELQQSEKQVFTRHQSRH